MCSLTWEQFVHLQSVCLSPNIIINLKTLYVNNEMQDRLKMMTYNTYQFVQPRLAPVLKTIFINVSYHIHVLVASLTLMALCSSP